MVVVDYLAWWSLGDGSPGNPTRPSEKDPSALRSVAFPWGLFFGSFASRVTADVFSPSLPVAHLFCSFSFLPSLAMLCYPPGRACPNFELFDPSECKEVAVSLGFANFDGSADHVSRDRRPSSFARVRSIRNSAINFCCVITGAPSIFSAAPVDACRPLTCAP